MGGGKEGGGGIQEKISCFEYLFDRCAFAKFIYFLPVESFMKYIYSGVKGRIWESAF